MADRFFQSALRVVIFVMVTGVAVVFFGVMLRQCVETSRRAQRRLKRRHNGGVDGVDGPTTVEMGAGEMGSNCGPGVFTENPMCRAGIPRDETAGNSRRQL